MFNPITASQEIKDAFTDYITTTFDFADPDYADELKICVTFRRAPRIMYSVPVVPAVHCTLRRL